MTNHELLCFLMLGFAAGGKVYYDQQKGGGANYVCLTQNPNFNQSTPGQDDSRSRIYPVEYRSWEGPLKPQHNHDAPCAVCQTTGCRTQVLMIPSSTLCPNGWNKEYDGYLVTARWDTFRTTYVCLDGNPESIPGGNASAEISLFFKVEIVNPDTSLPSNYETGKELSCAVCTM